MTRILIFIVTIVLMISCSNEPKSTGHSNTGTEIEETIKKPMKTADGVEQPVHDNPVQHTETKAPQEVIEPMPESSKAAKATEAQRSAPSASTEKKVQQPSSKLGKSVNTIGTACELITPEFIAKTIGVKASDISAKDGSKGRMEHGKACFFRWTHNGVPNSGVLVQVQHNPMPDEFPDWASYLVSAKLNHGDKTMDNEDGFRYNKLAGLGKAGAYNYELARYTWRSEEGNVFLIALNIAASEAEHLKWVNDMGQEIMKNFYK